MQLIRVLVPNFSAHLFIRVSGHDNRHSAQATCQRAEESCIDSKQGQETFSSQKVRVALGPLGLVSMCTGNLNPGVKWSVRQANYSPSLTPRLILKGALILQHCVTYILQRKVFTSYFTFHLLIHNYEKHVYVSCTSRTRDRTSYQGTSHKTQTFQIRHLSPSPNTKQIIFHTLQGEVEED